MILQAVPCPLTLPTIPSGTEAEVFTGWMPFPLPNQQCQSPEGMHKHFNINLSVGK